jgi:hypothetical protein
LDKSADLQIVAGVRISERQGPRSENVVSAHVMDNALLREAIGDGDYEDESTGEDCLSICVRLDPDSGSMKFSNPSKCL